MKSDIVLRWDCEVNNLGGRLRAEEERNGMKGDHTTGRNWVERKGVTILILDKHNLREGLMIEGMGRWMRNLCQRESVLTGSVDAKYLEEGLRTEQERDDKKGGNTEEEHCVERKCVLR